MNRFSCRTYRIAKTLLLAALLLAGGATGAGAQIILRLGKIDVNDTLRVGVFSEEGYARASAVFAKYGTAIRLVWLTEKSEEMETVLSDEAVGAQLAGWEKEHQKKLMEYRKLPEGDMKRKLLDAEMKSYEILKKEHAARVEETKPRKEAIDSAVALHHASEYSPARIYAYKREIATYTVDGRLHNYIAARPFRHGRAAVARKTDGDELWGFVDGNGREVIPCRYSLVFDFNNRKFYKSGGVFERLDDQDDRPWTTAWNREGMGMIDRDGRMVIPFRFSTHHDRTAIVFYKTRWGEFAPVYDRKTNKEGIIDRSGNYTLKPTHFSIVFYTDLQCFGTQGKDRIFFDPYGNKIEH